MSDRSSAPTTRQRLRARLEPLLDVTTTDLLCWEAVKAPRRPKAQVELTIKPIDKANATDYEAVAPPQLYQEAQAFLQRDDTGHVAMAGDAFAGWVWVSRQTHRDPWSGLRIALAPDEAYAYALWVPDDYRPKGVARVLMSAMLDGVYEDPALTRVYGWVDKRNRESQFLLRLLGFKDVQSVKRAMVLGRHGFRVPRSDHPRFGPLSRDGRHKTTAHPAAALGGPAQT